MNFFTISRSHPVQNGVSGVYIRYHHTSRVRTISVSASHTRIWSKKTCFPQKNTGKPAEFLRNASYMPYMMAPDALFSRAGHFWPIFGRFWPIFGRFWPFLAHSGPIWPNLTQFGPSWPFLDHLPTIQYAGSRKSPESGQIRPESARIA